jgi:adenine C2-methylase RlmN of 23S rRNA A2503 and tRNA A37
MTKINKKYIEKLVLQEIRCFRDNKGEQVASDYWLCNQIG